jgi:hypothetical protein
MAYARSVFNIDASKAGLADPQNRQFDIDFPYLDKGHVKVLLDGVASLQYEWVNDYRIQLDEDTEVGQVVTFVRETSPDTRLVDYQTGSVLSEEILDQDSLQGFYLAQEANDIKEVALSRDGANRWDANGSRMINLADPVDIQDAATKAWVVGTTAQQVADVQTFRDQAYQYKEQSIANAGASLASAGLASQNNGAAAGHVLTALGYRNDAGAYRLETQELLNAAKIPGSLVGKAQQFLQVKTDETGYVLVSSVAAPSFFGFKMSDDGQELLMTYGRDQEFDVADYDTWTMSENITFAVTNNNLAVVL